MVLRATGDLQGAIVAYKEAIRLKPDDIQNYYNLGAVYVELKKFEEAIACAREALKRDSKYADAHALLGFGLQVTGDLSGARAALAEAIRLDSKKWKPIVGALLSQLSREVAPPPREK
jgi:tetratricopeptide (TPR) repeat protein